jgi:hypothetical protein
MPVNPTLIANAILAASPDLTGLVWPSLCQAVGIGVSTWIVGNPANFALTGVTVGTVGTGSVTGTLVFPPQPALVLAQMTETGVLASRIGESIAFGVSTGLTGSQYVGVSTGVGTGTDTSFVSLSNGATLTASLLLACQGLSLVGVDIPNLCVGLGNGLAAMLQLGTGVGVVAGPSGPAPSTGVSLSTVF